MGLLSRTTRSFDETGEHAGFAMGLRRRGAEAVVWNVDDDAGQLFQRDPGARIGGIEPAKEMSELRKTDHRVIYQSHFEQRIDGARRLALQDVDVYARIE